MKQDNGHYQYAEKNLSYKLEDIINYGILLYFFLMNEHQVLKEKSIQLLPNSSRET